MSAPERIWAVHHETQDAVMIGEWADTVRHLGGTEYIRADVVQALADALRDLMAIVEDARADLPPTLEQAKELPEIKALVEALDACIASLERADTEEGVCCCGYDMATHGEPINCGHIPVDMGDYYAGKALDAARAAMSAIEEDFE